MDKEIFSCEEHIDMAIDDYVNYFEEAPEVLKITLEKCAYCDRAAYYSVKKPSEFYWVFKRNFDKLLALNKQ